MAADNSFDVVSKLTFRKLRNAVDQASKGVHARFDLKNSHSEIKLEDDEAIQLASADEYKLKAVTEILQQKLVKRGISLKNLTYGKVEQAAGSSVRQKITPATGDSDGEGEGYCSSYQRLEEKVAGFDSGRYGTHQRQGSRYSTRGDRAAEGP